MSAAHKEFHLKTRVRWCDMDAFGHANNLAYWRWCEDVRINMLDELGFNLTHPFETGLVLVAAKGDWHAPVFMDDELDVTCRIVRLGKSSHDGYYEIKRGTMLAFSATCTLVYTDLKTNRSLPIPDAMRALLAP